MRISSTMILRADGVASAVARAAIPLAALALVAIGGCHLPPRGAGSVSPAAGGGTLITEEDIAQMSVRTAWDAVRLRAPRLTVGQDATGRPTGVRIQEQRSINADETPLLVVDGVQVSAIEYLMQIPASQVHSIRILRSEAAEPLYGLRAAGGAIVVETKRGT
jgi:outer membrane cobalamin receptor